MNYLPRIVLVFLVFVAGCSMKLSSMGGTVSPQDPVFPRTNSILPLAQGNTWYYTYTAYDSTGSMIMPHRLDLVFSIDAQYGILNDTILTKITMNNYTTEFKTYAYQYEMEDRDSGYLLTYRQLYPLWKRGVYIIGFNDHGSCVLYPEEQLWLAYPADSGFAWQFKYDPLGDTTATVQMEIISLNARCILLDSTQMTGIRVVDSCYLYRQTSDEWVSYYYYHERFGAIAYQRFYRGVLRETYLLKSLQNEFARTLNVVF